MRPKLTANEQKLLRREGLANASNDEIDDRVTELRADGRDATADKLADVLTKLQRGDGQDEPADEPKGKEKPKGTSKGKAKGRGGSKRAGGRRRRRGPIGRALRRSMPDYQVARGIDSASDAIWWWIGLMGVALLLATVVRHPKGFSDALNTVSGLFQDVVNPKALRASPGAAVHPTSSTVTKRTGVYA